MNKVALKKRVKFISYSTKAISAIFCKVLQNFTVGIIYENGLISDIPIVYLKCKMEFHLVFEKNPNFSSGLYFLVFDLNQEIFCRDLRGKSAYSVLMCENTDQKNSNTFLTVKRAR